MASAYLAEIFSGIQGEGLYLGERQLFIRFCGCNLRCRYCDTPGATRRRKEFRVEKRPGGRVFVRRRNPVRVERLVSLVHGMCMDGRLHRAVVLTGGEPLLHAEFLSLFLPEARDACGRVYLETNATLPDALGQLLRWIDVVSADVKLRSVTDEEPRYVENVRFLRAAGGKDLFVKMVVGSRTSLSELCKAVDVVASVDEEIPVVLQPVTARGGVRPPSPGKLLEMQAAAAGLVRTVRVIPQLHKLMGQM